MRLLSCFVTSVDILITITTCVFIPIQQGRRATVAFLRHYADLHLQDFRQDPVEPFSRDDLQHYIDDDLSEIIDPRDYSEKPTVKSIKK